MNRSIVLTLLPLALCANDWEKFYRPVPPAFPVTESVAPAIANPSSGNGENDVNAMWVKGYTLIGISSFNSSNSKVTDAEKFANKLHASYFIVVTQLTSSNTTSIPFTTPTLNTSTTNGNVSGFSGGTPVNGNYSGTTTTTGSQTNYIPITINRFDKVAIYFKPFPKMGTGILIRPLTAAEMAHYDTSHARYVRAVRAGSPADTADILPGDVLLAVNGKPVDADTWAQAIETRALHVKLARADRIRELDITIPPEWK